jgi:hypothetical protein
MPAQTEPRAHVNARRQAMASADQAPPPRVADECPALLYAPNDSSGGLFRFIGASRPPPPGRLDVSRALSLPSPRSSPRAAPRGAARSRAAAYIPGHHLPPTHPLKHRRASGALVPWLEGSAAPRTLRGRSAYRGPDGSVGPRLTCSCVRQHNLTPACGSPFSLKSFSRHPLAVFLRD